MCWPPGRADRRYAGVTHIDVQHLDDAGVGRIREATERTGVSISGLGYYPNPLSDDSVESEIATTHLRRVIDASARLGIGVVNSFIGRDPSRSLEQNWSRMLQLWAPIVDHAEERGVKIGIENCPMLFTRDEWPGGKNLMTTPASWRRAFNDIDSASFGLNYDPSHFVLQGMDPLSPLAEFRDKLFHLHAKDVKIDRAALNEVGRFDFPLRWHQPRIPGYGEIDWASFMGELMRIGYDGPLCIEVEDDTFGKTLEGRMKAVKVARNILAPFFA
jgi:sugar phosphate isomerase/epimerase